MVSPNYSVLQIRPAKDSLTGQAAFVEFLASLKTSLKAKFLDRLLGSYETISLEIINLNQTTFFVVACPHRLEALVRSQIAAQYPSALITPMEEYLPTWVNHGHPVFARLVLAQPSQLPINVTEDEKVDQMASILGSLSRIVPGQAAIIQICLFASPGNWQKSLRKNIDAGIPSGETVKPHPQKTQIEKKLLQQAYSADIRLVAISPDEQTSKHLMSQLAAAFGTYALSEGNSFKLKYPNPYLRSKLKKMIVERSAKYSNQYQFLNYSEIAALYHLPGFNLAPIKGIAWGKTLKGEPPTGLPIDEDLQEDERNLINFFAKTEYKNHMAVFGMKKGDDRRRHVYILGKSGTGKSTLIANMAVNDIQRGEGMALVDPHGDTDEKLLDFIPTNRIDDVAYLDPSIVGQSFHLNPLYVKNPAYGELVASGIVSIFSKLYGNSWGPRLEYILRNTLLTLVGKPGATLLDVPRLLTNKDFREDYLNSVKDPVLINFWHDEYDKYSEKFQSEAISPILNKVGQFITSPTIRDIISHPNSTVDFEDMMNEGKIIILNLPQGKIGEDNAALLGAMFISQIQIAAMNRANMEESKRKDFFLYVDEFQNFATTSFIKILSEARKYRLNLILANQYTAQLPIEIQDAIFGNAGTLISFVVGAADANRLMNELGNFYTQDDLVSLPRYQIITKMSVNQTISTPFPAYTLPIPKTETGNKEKVLEATKTKYYRKTESFEEQAAAYIASQPTPSAAPRRDDRQRPDYRPATQIRPQYDNRTRQDFRPPVQSQTPYIKTQPVASTPTTSLPPTPTIPQTPPQEPKPEGLDSDRQEGLRPSVVGCFTHSGKILFVYQKIHQLWQLPQGGVDNKETLKEAFIREMTEELGEAFVGQVDQKPSLISVNKIEFPPDKQGTRDLKLDNGTPVVMKGKKYYFLQTNSQGTEIKFPTAEEYGDYRWVDYNEASELAQTSSQGGKLRITINALDWLKKKGLLFSGIIVNNQSISKNNEPGSAQPPTTRPNNISSKPRFDNRTGKRPGPYSNHPRNSGPFNGQSRSPSSSNSFKPASIISSPASMGGGRISPTGKPSVADNGGHNSSRVDLLGSSNVSGSADGNTNNSSSSGNS